MKAEELRKQEFTAVTRRNRVKTQVKRSAEDIVLEQKRLKQEREYRRIAAMDARAAAALIISEETTRQEEVAKSGKALIPMLDDMAGTDTRKANKAKVKFNKLFPSTTSSERAKKTHLARLRKDMSHQDWVQMNKGVREAADLE